MVICAATSRASRLGPLLLLLRLLFEADWGLLGGRGLLLLPFSSCCCSYVLLLLLLYLGGLRLRGRVDLLMLNYCLLLLLLVILLMLMLLVMLDLSTYLLLDKI